MNATVMTPDVDEQVMSVPPAERRGMSFRTLGGFIWYSFGLVLLALLAFAALRLLKIPAGQLIDWVVGIVSFWWLLVIVTVPWNVHFQARATLAEAALSREKNIALDEKQIEYVQRVSRRSLWTAVAVHLCSASGLLILALAGISVVGYVSSVAALLLTGLRPSVRAYEYLWARLVSIRRQFLYPREDVIELRGRFGEVEMKVRQLTEQMDATTPLSWAAVQARTLRELGEQLVRVSRTLEELRETNRREHERLARETQQAVAQLSADSEFLGHIREILRVFKEA